MSEGSRTHGAKTRFGARSLCGAALLLAGVVAVVGIASAGSPHPASPPAAKESLAVAATPAAPTTDCNVLEQLLNMCATTTTTTTTPPAPTIPATTTSVPGAPSEPAEPSATGATTTTDPTSTTTEPPSPGTEACAGTAPPIAPPSGTWSCTFDDEFNGSSLDTSKWQPVLTSTSNYLSGPFLSQVCYVDNPSTISESGGYLDLSVVEVSPYTTCDQPGGASLDTSYEGGMIETYNLFSQKYGYFEVRAEMPSTSVPGLQETLWLYPENETLYGPWPNSGEIDYGEFYSSYPADDVPAVHYPGSSNDPDATATNGCTLAGDTTAGQFNTYALSWTPTTLTTYYNGVPCLTDDYSPYVTYPDTAPEPFNQPFFLAFTSALGMDGDDTFQAGTTPLPDTMKIDWVRVWQY